jgi:hypothetical protein
VRADINAYYTWYHLNGIFFNQASTNCGYSSYYAGLNSYAKAEGGTARTILNPGTQTNGCYVTDADTLLTFEGSDMQYVTSYSAPVMGCQVLAKPLSGTSSTAHRTRQR